jgi:hypothetical protein
MPDEADRTIPSTWHDQSARNQRITNDDLEPVAFANGLNNAASGSVIGIAVGYGALHNDPNFDDGVNGLGLSGDPASWTVLNGLPHAGQQGDAEFRTPSRGQSIGGLGYNDGLPYFFAYNPSEVFPIETGNQGDRPTTPDQPALVTTAAGWIADAPVVFDP